MQPQNSFCTRTLLSGLCIFLLPLLLSSTAIAQRSGTAAGGGSIVPDRPRAQEEESVAAVLRKDACDPSTVEGTCPGTFFFTYGFSANARPRDGGSQSQKLGLSFTVYLHRRFFVTVDNDNMVSVKNETDQRETGFGDTTIYGGYDALLQRPGRPAITLVYGVKAPTASEEKGLGSGEVDHVVLGAVAKKFGRNYLEFDLGDYIAGRANESGYDNIPFAAGIYKRELNTKFVLHTEFGGEFATSKTNATLYNLTYLQSQLSDRALLRTGIRVGLTPNVSRVGFYVGIRFAGMFGD